MDEVIMIGDWIDYGDKIYEVIADKGNDLICKEVLYKSEDWILRYGEPEVISKKLLQEGTWEVKK